MMSMRIFQKCFLYNGFKVPVLKNMSNVVTESNTIPKHLCNLEKQLNISSTKLAEVINNNQENLKSYPESQWIILFEYLKQYDFKASEILEMVDSYPYILSINRQKLHKSMYVWTQFRFDDKKLKQLLTMQPSCLLLNDKEILSRIPKLLAYVKNKHNRVLELISYSPNVMFDDWKHLESKFNYLLLNMELGPTQFVTTTALSSTLFDLKCRHIFLMKLGMYKTRDPKENQNQLIGNPSLKRIIETRDQQFATKVAGVTAEEYFVFKKIFKKQLDEEEEDDEEDDDEENLDDNEYNVE